MIRGTGRTSPLGKLQNLVGLKSKTNMKMKMRLMTRMVGGMRLVHGMPGPIVILSCKVSKRM